MSIFEFSATLRCLSPHPPLPLDRERLPHVSQVARTSFVPAGSTLRQVVAVLLSTALAVTISTARAQSSDGASASTVTQTESGTLSLGSGALVESSGALTTGGTIVASGASTYGGATLSGAGSIISVNGSGGDSGASLIVNGSAGVSGATIDSGGTLTLNGGYFGTGVIVTTATFGGGLTTVSGSGALTGSSISGTLTGTLVLASSFTDNSTFTLAGPLYSSLDIVTAGGSPVFLNGNLSWGSGSLVITGSFPTLSGSIAQAAGSSATLTVSGASSDWKDSGNLVVGGSGTGTLAISGGGAVSDVNGYIGYGTGSIGNVAVSGSGSKWTTSNLDIGNLGFGVLSVQGGGAVKVSGSTTIGPAGGLEFDGASTFTTGSLTINGGALVSLAPATFATSATLGTGGVRINTDSFNATFSGNFSGAGGLTKVGSGVATLTGASTYTGATVVKGGTLALTTGSAQTASLGNTAITVMSGATLSATFGASPFSEMVTAGTTGSGTAGATLNLEAGSTFSMAGKVLANFYLHQEDSFSGPAFTIGGASGIAPTLIFDIGNGSAGTDFLHFNRTVSVLATGGDITIDALAGDTSLTAGNYDLIVTDGGFSGTNGNGLTLSDTTLAIGGTTYDLSLAHSTADDEILTVSDAPASTSAPASHAAPLIQTNSVPEPSAAASLLAAFGIAAGSMLRRRR